MAQLAEDDSVSQGLLQLRGGGQLLLDAGLNPPRREKGGRVPFRKSVGEVGFHLENQLGGTEGKFGKVGGGGKREISQRGVGIW